MLKIFGIRNKKKTYVLMHKNVAVLAGDYDSQKASFNAITEVFSYDHVPYSARENGSVSLEHLNHWLRWRGIPGYRVGLDRLLSRLEVESPRELLSKYYGLSVSDHYWLREEEEQLKGKIDKLKKRLKNLKGEVLTAEQAKAVEIKKAPLGMALLKYKDAVDLKKTAERVDQSDNIINRKYEILSDARKRAEEITNDASKKLEETEHLLELRLSEVDELTDTIRTLIHVKNIIRELEEEERKRGIDREKLLKKADTIRKNYEQSKQQSSSEHSQNHTQGQNRRRR